MHILNHFDLYIRFSFMAAHPLLLSMDAGDIDLDLVLLKTQPLEALRSLQSKLPEAAPQLRRRQHLLCPLCCNGLLAAPARCSGGCLESLLLNES